MSSVLWKCILAINIEKVIHLNISLFRVNLQFLSILYQLKTKLVTSYNYFLLPSLNFKLFILQLSAYSGGVLHLGCH